MLKGTSLKDSLVHEAPASAGPGDYCTQSYPILQEVVSETQTRDL